MYKLFFKNIWKYKKHFDNISSSKNGVLFLNISIYEDMKEVFEKCYENTTFENEL